MYFKDEKFMFDIIKLVFMFTAYFISIFTSDNSCSFWSIKTCIVSNELEL